MTRRVALATLVLILLAAAAAVLVRADGRAWLRTLLPDGRRSGPSRLRQGFGEASRSAEGAKAAGPPPLAAATDSEGIVPSAAVTEGTPRVPVTLDVRRQQLIGVRTARAQRVMSAPEVRAVGAVQYDETRLTEINVRTDGWIRGLVADYTGKAIQRGEPLFRLYSPELIATQEEYLLAVRGRTQALGGQASDLHEYSTRLVEAARARLLRWDMAPEDIQELEQRGSALETIAVRSPVSGVIVEKTAVEGMHVDAGQTLFRVADLSVVWVEADVYERDMATVRVGQAATVTLDAYPDRRFVGRATYIYPFVDEQTRTSKVRFQFPNPRGLLKPGMYANVQLTGSARVALSVPADAVLDSGTEQVIFVALGDGYFEPRRVRIGRRMDAAIEIAEGLKEGEEVATGATFFLDSESQLRAAVRGFESPPSGNVTGQTPGERLDITFRSQPDPPRVGDNMFEVSVRDASGQPVTDADVSVTFFMAAMPTMNMPAMRNEAKLPRVGGGVYRGPGQVITPGRWDVTVTVARGGQRLGSRQL